MLLPGWLVVLAAVLLWPITRRGYLLGHDMVFTPQQPLNLPAIGLSSAPPRAVPLDALVALAERVLDGAVVGRLALLVPVIGAGLGIAAVLRDAPLAARVAAATAAVWNPFVVERLGLGQWALVWCYAALPWLLVAIVRGRGAAGWPGRGLALAAASITPTGGLIASIVAVAGSAAARRARSDVLATAGVALAIQLPWVVPSLVSTAATTSDPAGVAAFAARGEQPGGVLPTLLGGGGIWDADVVPGSRGGGLPWVWIAMLVAAAVYGTPRLAVLLGRRLVATLAALAGGGLVLAALPSSSIGAAVVRALVRDVPGAGLLRDAQKWVLPLVMFEVLLVGAGAARLAERLATVPWRVGLLVAGAALPLVVLPDAAAALRPTLEPVHYPADWSAVSKRIGSGDAAALPWNSYRSFRWAPGRTVLDPAPRLLPAPVVVDDRLAVSGTVLTGEDPRAAAVLRVLSAGPPVAQGLAAHGIRWVVVEHGTPGLLPGLRGLTPVFRGADVSLYRVPGTVVDERASPLRVTLVLIGDGTAAVLVISLVGWAVGSRFRRARTRPKARSKGTPRWYSPRKDRSTQGSSS